jgi:hypothetical protein
MWARAENCKPHQIDSFRTAYNIPNDRTPSQTPRKRELCASDCPFRDFVFFSSYRFASLKIVLFETHCTLNVHSFFNQNSNPDSTNCGALTPSARSNSVSIRLPFPILIIFNIRSLTLILSIFKTSFASIVTCIIGN